MAAGAGRGAGDREPLELPEEVRLVPPEAEAAEEDAEDPDATAVLRGKADIVEGMDEAEYIAIPAD